MNITNAGFSIIEEEHLGKKIEKVARICYKSEDKITDESWRGMVSKLVERKHYAMLEHASLVYEVTRDVYSAINGAMHLINHCVDDRISHRDMTATPRINTTSYINNNFERYIVSGNLRAWIEFFEACKKYRIPLSLCSPLVNAIYLDSDGIVDFRYDFKFIYALNNVLRITIFDTLTPQERMIHETFTALFTVDRGVTHEIVRMRDSSFAQESTRYVNYSLGKYGNEITVIEPCFFSKDSSEYNLWKLLCETAENTYIELTKELKVAPQKARDVLPQSTKADIAVTTNLMEWRHIFELRACDLTGPAHPQMKEVMVPLLKEVTPKYEFAFGDLIPAEQE